MDVLFSRKFVNYPQESEVNASVKPICIASYNILADCHSLRGLRDWSQYKWTTEEDLKITSRYKRLLPELKYLNADIYCLQEVSPSFFHDLLLPALASSGYDGVFKKRHGDIYDEGEAIIFQKERFELLKSEGVWLKELASEALQQTQLNDEQKQGILERIESAAVMLLAKLKCKVTGKELSVGSIHVEFGHLIKDDLQCVQISSALKALVEFAGGPDKAHVIAGDFNSVPSGPGYQLASTGRVTGACMTHLESLKEIGSDAENKDSLISLWKEGFQHPSGSLKSAYYTVQGKEPLTSVFPHDSCIRAVDYIWYSSECLDIHGVLETVPPAEIESGIPNAVNPSDHLSVKAIFSFK